MASFLEELFILIDWEDGKSLVCPISKIVKPKKAAGEYYIGESVLAKRPRLGNKYGVIAAIHDDRTWLKSLKSEVDTPRPAQNGLDSQLSHMRDLPDSSTGKEPVANKETAVISSALKISSGISSVPSPENPASTLKSSVCVPNKPAGQTISNIPPLENPSGETVASASLSGRDSSTGKEPVATKETTAISSALKTSSGISSIPSPENPPSTLKSSVCVPNKPAGQTIAIIPPLEIPSGETIASDSLSETSGSQQESEISSLETSPETPAHRKRRDSSNLPLVSDSSPPKKLYTGVTASEPIITSPIASCSEPSEQNVGAAELMPLNLVKKSSCKNSVNSLEPAKIKKSVSETSEESDDVARFVSMKEFKNLQKEVEELKYQLRAMKQIYERVDSATSSDERKFNGYTHTELKKMVQFETDTYKAAWKLLNTIFTEDDLLKHTFSGKPPNSKIPAKPKFDRELYNVYCNVMREIFPGIEHRTLLDKTQSVQKSIQRQHKLRKSVKMNERKKAQAILKAQMLLKAQQKLRAQQEFKAQTIATTQRSNRWHGKRFNGHTFDDLKAMVYFETEAYGAAWTLLNALFSTDYLLEHTVSGRAPNSRIPAKPKIDQELYSVYCDVLLDLFPGIKYSTITQKTQFVQSKLKMQSLKRQSEASCSAKV